MEEILVGTAVLAAVVLGALALLSRRRRRVLLAEGLAALGVLGIVAGGLSWGAWITGVKVDADVLGAHDGRCQVRWMDPGDRTFRQDSVDCETSGERAVARDDTLIVKAQTGVLRGTAVAHRGLTTTLARFWVPGIATVLAVVGALLLGRRERRLAVPPSILPR